MWDLIVPVPDHCLSFYFVHVIEVSYFHARPTFCIADAFDVALHCLAWENIGHFQLFSVFGLINQLKVVMLNHKYCLLPYESN